MLLEVSTYRSTSPQAGRHPRYLRYRPIGRYPHRAVDISERWSTSPMGGDRNLQGFLKPLHERFVGG